MKKHTHRNRQSSEVNLGFQIAPMIDVVFVILLYFMVMAGDVRVEKFNHARLPGPPPEPSKKIVCPDEVIIRIEDDGQVYLNDDPLDSSDSRHLPELASNLDQLNQINKASSSPLLVTICASELSKYQRVVDVLDALSLADITNISFQAGGNE